MSNLTAALARLVSGVEWCAVDLQHAAAVFATHAVLRITAARSVSAMHGKVATGLRADPLVPRCVLTVSSAFHLRTLLSVKLCV